VDAWWPSAALAEHGIKLRLLIGLQNGPNLRIKLTSGPETEQSSSQRRTMKIPLQMPYFHVSIARPVA
jgi:hypothetical protein